MVRSKCTSNWVLKFASETYQRPTRNLNRQQCKNHT